MNNPWSDKESNVRKEKFLKAYETLVAEYGIELMAVPQYVPSGQQGFNTAAYLVPIDKRHQPVPSPLQDKNGEILK